MIHGLYRPLVPHQNLSNAPHILAMKKQTSITVQCIVRVVVISPGPNTLLSTIMSWTPPNITTVERLEWHTTPYLTRNTEAPNIPQNERLSLWLDDVNWNKHIDAVWK